MNMLNALNPQQAGGFAQPAMDHVGQTMNWLKDRPQHMARMDQPGFRAAMMDWRAQRPQFGGSMMQPGMGQVNPGAQVNPGVQIAPQQQPMIGQSYAVQALNPSSNPYQFGTYTPGG